MKIMPIHNNEVRIFCGDYYIDVLCYDFTDRIVFHIYPQDKSLKTFEGDHVVFEKSKKGTNGA